MLDKKAQDLSIATLILIVLGIIVLVLLVMGFAMGWDKLWDRINIFGGDVTINDKVTGCTNLANTNGDVNYCTKFDEIEYNDKKIWMNCQYDPVEDRLTQTLDCQYEEGINVRDQCLKLFTEKKLKSDTQVNTRICMSEYKTCADYGGIEETKQNIGSPSALESDTKACEDVKGPPGDSPPNIPYTKPIRSGIKDANGNNLAADKICCVAP